MVGLTILTGAFLMPNTVNADNTDIVDHLGLNETEYESLIAGMTKKSIDVLNENSAWPKIYLGNGNQSAKK